MTLAIICIIVVHTYVIGFALGLGKSFETSFNKYKMLG